MSNEVHIWMAGTRDGWCVLSNGTTHNVKRVLFPTGVWGTTQLRGVDAVPVEAPGIPTAWLKMHGRLIVAGDIATVDRGEE